MTEAAPSTRGRVGRFAAWGATVASLSLAGCANPPAHEGARGNGRYFDPVLGVYASPRLVSEGEPVPRGGGGYLVGRPYTIGGRTYHPRENAQGYSVVGTASWYGDAFHGRRTANGEIFDKNSISAAHPTLPLPSYARVTNLGNGRSMVVRVNDRGPYHGGRVMDVSQRVAESLDFKGAGTAHIRVDYIGPASLGGSDDAQLLATLRDGGAPTGLDGAEAGTLLADARGDDAAAPPPVPSPPPMPEGDDASPEGARDPLADPPAPPPTSRYIRSRRPAPVPPERPYELAAEPAPPRRPPRADRAGLDHLISFGGTVEPAAPRRLPAVSSSASAFVEPERSAFVRRPTPNAADGDAQDP